ncbi:MAG: SRPBCC domain-containing protein [Planctomycetota bacterium]
MSESPNYIRLHKFVRAPKQRVFEALTATEDFSEWFMPGPGMRCHDVVLEKQVGGRFRFTMKSTSGQGPTMHGGGTVKTYDPYDKLAYTWEWDERPSPGGESLVTWELFDAENPYDDGKLGTEIVLTHDHIADAVERSESTGGWWNCLRALGYHVRGVDPREAMFGTNNATA